MSSPIPVPCPTGFDDAVVRAKVTSQIALDGVQDLGVVVDREHDGFGHVFWFCALGARRERRNLA
jgi:hypothetical protein